MMDSPGSALAELRQRAASAHQRILAWLHGDGAGTWLVDRLVQDRGWTVDHARRAVDAYARFLALASVGRGPCPSISVESVRTLHLSHPGYVRFQAGALEGACTTVLVEDGFPALVERWRAYQTTLDAHALLFGPPDPLLWTPVESRFTAPADFVAWAPAPRRRIRWFLGVALAVAGLAVVATRGSWGWLLAGAGLLTLLLDLLVGNSHERYRCPSCDLGAMAPQGMDPIAPNLVLGGWRCGACRHTAVEVRRGPQFRNNF